MTAGLPVVTASQASAATVVRGLHVNDVAKRYSISAGDEIKVLFSGVPGQVLVVQSSAGTFEDECGASVQVLDPAGAPVTEPICGGQAVDLPVPMLTRSGLYAVVLTAVDGTQGSLSMRVRASASSARTITPNAGPLPMSIPIGKTHEYGFRLERGEFLYTDVNGWSFGDDWFYQLIAPDGSLAADDWFTSLDRFEASMSGVYRLRITNRAQSSPALKLSVVKGRDQVGSIVPGGPEVTAALGLKGQRALFTFDALKGQRVLIDTTASSWNGPEGGGAAVTVVGPGGTYNPGGYWNGVVRTTGRQTLIVDPATWTTGSANLRLRLVDDPPRRLISIGDTVTGELTQAQVAHVNFAAERGQVLRYRVESSASGRLQFSYPGVENPSRSLRPDRVLEGTQVITRTGLWEVSIRQFLAEEAVGTYSVTLELDSDRSISFGEPKVVTLRGNAGSSDSVDFYVDQPFDGPRTVNVTVSDNTMTWVGAFLNNEVGGSSSYHFQSPAPHSFSFSLGASQAGYYRFSLANLGSTAGSLIVTLT